MNLMIRFISILIFVFLTLIKSLAQQPIQTIRGIVIDNASNTPLPFATVIILNTDPLIGTITDSQGNFILNNIGSVSYTHLE